MSPILCEKKSHAVRRMARRDVKLLCQHFFSKKDPQAHSCLIFHHVTPVYFPTIFNMVSPIGVSFGLGISP